MEEFQAIFGTQLVALIGKLQSLGVDESWVQLCATDFELARLTPATAYTLKHAPYDEPPWCAFGLVHKKEDVRLKAFKKLRTYLETSGNVHKLLKPLQSGTLGGQFEVWGLQLRCSTKVLVEEEDDLPTGDMPELRTFLCTLRLARSSERHVERPHAASQRETKRARGH